MRAGAGVGALMLLASTACDEDLGVLAARFSCATQVDCADGFFCDAADHVCVDHGCGDGVVDADEECELGPGCTSCQWDFGNGEKFVDLAAGESHACAITEEGKIICEGSNLDHAGGVVGQAVPPAGTFKQISLGQVHSCALRTDGHAICWGADERIYSDREPSPARQTTKTPTTVEFTAIDAGGYHACGLTTTSTVMCWGAGGYCQNRDVGRQRRYNAVSAGFNHNCGIHDNDRIHCWGGLPIDDVTGECPVLLSDPSGTFKEISSGWSFLCAIDSAGGIACFGGIAGATDPPAGNTFSRISCGRFHCCALREDHVAECWGFDGPEHMPFPSPPDDIRLTKISSGPQYMCGLREDGFISCFGRVFETTPDD